MKRRDKSSSPRDTSGKRREKEPTKKAGRRKAEKPATREARPERGRRSEPRGRDDEVEVADERSEGGKPQYSKTAVKLFRKLRKTCEARDGAVTVDEELLPALGKVGDRAVPPLAAYLGDPRWEARYCAALALDYLHRKRYARKASEAIPGLVDALEFDDPRVRARAIEALGGFSAQRSEVLPALVKALGDQDADVSRTAVMQVLELSRGHERSTTRLMVKVLDKKRNTLSRIGALLVLFHLGKEAREAVPSLLPLLEDPEPEIREYAHLAVMGIRTPSMRLQIIRTASMRLKVADETEPSDEAELDELSEIDDLAEELDEEEERAGSDADDELDEEDEEVEEDEDDDRPRAPRPRRRRGGLRRRRR